MKTIQSKLLAFFLALLLLLSGVFALLHYGTQRSIALYDTIVQLFLLVNEISQRTQLLMQALNAYLVDKSPHILREYEQHKRVLLADQNALTRTLATPENWVTVKNYRNLIASLIEETDQTLRVFAEGDIDRYSDHYREAQNIALYILETTLQLIDRELTAYHQVYAQLRDTHRAYETMGALVFGATLFLSVLFAYLFARGIARPIRRLALAAKEISQGKLDGPVVEVPTRDEVALLAEAFNRMRDSLRRLIDEMKQKAELEKALHAHQLKAVEMDRLLKEIELRSLQNQINPHFLFNTLNTVARMAYLEGAERTSELIVAVSGLLRYSLRGLDRPVTLEEELRHVKDYCFIQKTRFGDRVAVEFDVDPGCLRQAVPSLTLQPLVENAFIHGIEPLERNGRIRLTVRRAANGVVVEVADNGVGMDEATLAALTSGEEPPAGERQTGHSTGIGLANVRDRLRLFYGRDDVMEIHATPGSGTTVRLVLPHRTIRDGGEEGGSCIGSSSLTTRALNAKPSG